MNSLKPAFDRATIAGFGLSPLAVMFWIVAIDEDRQQREREKKRRRKRQRLAQAQPPPAARHLRCGRFEARDRAHTGINSRKSAN